MSLLDKVLQQMVLYENQIHVLLFEFLLKPIANKKAVDANIITRIMGSAEPTHKNPPSPVCVNRSEMLISMELPKRLTPYQGNARETSIIIAPTPAVIIFFAV